MVKPVHRDVVKAAIHSFAKTICSNEVVLVPHDPPEFAQHSSCLSNCIQLEELLGGSKEFGFHFILRCTHEGGSYLAATHHVVWRDFDKGELLDVTPFHPDRLHHPLSEGGQIYFLPDAASTPQSFRRGNEMRIVMRPLLYFAVTQDDHTVDHVRKLNNAETEQYQSELAGWKLL